MGRAARPRSHPEAGRERTSKPRRRVAPGAGLVIRLTLPSRRDAVAPAVEQILLAARPARLGAAKLQDLAVAVTEAISNAVVHGNQLEARRPVEVTVKTSPGRVVVEVRDTGPGFDARAVSDPTDPENVMVPGGRGIFLMRRLAESVAFLAPGNAVRLSFRRGGRGRRARGRRPRR